MGSSRIKPLTVKEVEKLTAERPRTIRHHALGGVAGFVLVHTPKGYTGYALFYRHRGKLKKLTLGSTQALKLAVSAVRPTQRFTEPRSMRSPAKATSALTASGASAPSS